jgi:hypothetical protein
MVFPWAVHREYFWYLMQNFIKHYRGKVYGNMYPTARTFLPDRYEQHMNTIYGRSRCRKISEGSSLRTLVKE